MKRQPRQNEVANLISADGKVCFSIVERSDSFYEFYVDSLSFDQDEGISYWSQEGSPRTGIFEFIEDAEREIQSQFSKQF